MRHSFYLITIALALTLLGCSGGGSPLVPDSEEGLDYSKYQAVAENHQAWGVYDLTVDIPGQSVTHSPSRQIMSHVMSDGLPGDNSLEDNLAIDFAGIDRDKRIVQFDVTLTNPYPKIAARDVRCIVIGNHPGYYLLNADGATNILDDGDAVQVNTFIAFARDDVERVFPGGATITERFELHYPPNADFRNLKVAIDATHPGNCLEPYGFSSFSFENGSLRLGVADWQNDVERVTILAGTVPGGFNVAIDYDESTGEWTGEFGDASIHEFTIKNAEFIGRLVTDPDQLSLDGVGGVDISADVLPFNAQAGGIPGLGMSGVGDAGKTIRRMCWVRADSGGGSLWGLVRVVLSGPALELAVEINSTIKMSSDLQEQFYDEMAGDDEIRIILGLAGTPLDAYAIIKNDADAAFPEIKEIADEIKDRYRAAQPEIAEFREKNFEAFANNEPWAVKEFVSILAKHRADRPSLDGMITTLEYLREERARYITAMLRSTFDPMMDPIVEQLLKMPDTELTVRDYFTNSIFIKTIVRNLGEIGSIEGIARIETDYELVLINDHGHQALNAPVIWAAGYDGGTFDVLDYDTGSDSTHPALAAQYGPGQEQAFGGCVSVDDFNGHGTHTAGTIASLDAFYPGTGFGIDKLYNAKHCPASTWGTMLQSLQWAGLGGTVPDPAETISFSWAWGPITGCIRDASYTTSRGVDQTSYMTGMLWSIAAGNSSTGICADDLIITMPSDAYNSFCVAAMYDKNTNTRADDSRAGFSRYGPAVAPGGELRVKPDVIAPGQSIMSCNNDWEGANPDFVGMSGTSMAAPNISGASAVTMDAGMTTGLEVRAMLMNTAEDWNPLANGPDVDGPDNYTGYGYVNLAEVLVNLGNITADTIAQGDIRFYRHSSPSSTHDSVMVIWDRYVSGFTALYADIDLESWDDTTNTIVDFEDKTYDTRRFLYTQTTNDLVYKITANNVPSVSPTWDYVITAKGGSLSSEIFPGSIDPLLGYPNPIPVGIEVSITATITNNGDFMLRDVQGTLGLDTDMVFTSGSVATQLGAAVLAPTNSCMITWFVTLNAYSATPKHITCDTDATAYGETFTGYAEADLDVALPDPVLNVNPLALNFGLAQTVLPFEVTNTGYNTLDWTVDESGFPLWLSVDVNAGSTTTEIDTVNVTVDRTSLPTGPYSFDIPVNSAWGNELVHIDMVVAPPSLSANPAGLDFGTVQTLLPFTIENSGGGVLNWTIDDSVFPAWLSIDNVGDMTWSETDIVNVIVDRAALPFGPYNYTINISSDAGADTVVIDMEVPDPTAPSLGVMPTTLDFADLLLVLPFMISNPGGNVLTWVIDDSVFPTWLSIDNNGDTTTSEIDTVNVTVNRDSLPLTTYTYDILITSNGGDETVTVDMLNPNPVTAIMKIAETNLYFGTVLTQKNIVITNDGTGELLWQILHTGIDEFPAWLSANVYEGIVDELQPQGGAILTVDRAGLSPGLYTHDINVTSNGGDEVVHVFMQVPTPQPQIDVNFNELDFGTKLVLLEFIVSNIGEPGSTLDWLIPIAGKPAWLNASAFSGSIGTEQVSVVQVIVDRTNLNDGQYNHLFTLSSNGGIEDVNILMTVQAMDPDAPLQIAPMDDTTYQVCTWLSFAWLGNPGAYDGLFWMNVKVNGQTYPPFANLPIATNSLTLPPQLVDKMAKYGDWEWRVTAIESQVPPVHHNSEWWTIHKPRPELIGPAHNAVVDADTIFSWKKVPTSDSTRTVYVAKVTGFGPIDPLYAWWIDGDVALLPPNWYDILNDLGGSNTYTWTIAAVCEPWDGMSLAYAQNVRYPPPRTFHLN